MKEEAKLVVHFWVAHLIMLALPALNGLLSLVGMNLSARADAADLITTLLVSGLGVWYSKWAHSQALAFIPPSPVIQSPLK